MADWIVEYKTLLIWLASGSVVLFVVTLAAIPWVILRLPADFISERKRHRKSRQTHRSAGMQLLIVVGKNCLGGVLVLLGLVMLVTPGQGVLTIAVGLMLMNFPGKFRIQRWLISRGPVLRTINRFRRKHGREPIALPPSENKTP